MACQRSTKLNLLRLAVLLIVALAGIKFLLRDSLTLELHRHIPKDSGFWGDTGDTSQGAGPRSQALELPVAKITAPRQGPGQQGPKDSSGTEMRLVHLDLKGAAPKVSYLEQLFPLLSRLGANGVLIEYEDMFPFKGELEVLRSPYAYSEEDIDWIQQLAELHKLEVVPLVQTFGHVEFILKHEKYQHLREVERFPNSFNPHVPDTLALLKSLLSQVMEKHRRSSWIHIGADEVFHLGEGMDSKSWMSHNRGDVGTMYLKHIKQVLGFIAARYQGLRALMWDDMLRKISTGALRESGIAKQVSPVVWFYAPDFEVEQIGQFLTKYAESGFEAVWFASAFKGTTGPAQTWPPLNHHVRNQLSWLRVMQAMPRFAPLRFQGIVLTGWQRYDHYSVLCELLPVGIPSLAACLQTLVHGERGRAPHPHPSSIVGAPLAAGEGAAGLPWCGVGSPGSPLLVLLRGLHGGDAEEGPGRAGLPEPAAGAGHVVRGCGTERGAPGGSGSAAPSPAGCGGSPPSLEPWLVPCHVLGSHLPSTLSPQ
uniref:beta-N-acetylhexosaminidase n=1 Tax=Anas platyrhynchos platyrhynchos TaxID=8840 RepID=A0A493T7Y7_ANAPP